MATASPLEKIDPQIKHLDNKQIILDIMNVNLYETLAFRKGIIGQIGGLALIPASAALHL